MRISDWSSDVCSSDLAAQREAVAHLQDHLGWASGGRAVSLMQTARACGIARSEAMMPSCGSNCANWHSSVGGSAIDVYTSCSGATASRSTGRKRSEEHTSELQSLMRISYAVFCLKKKKNNNNIYSQQIT